MEKPTELELLENDLRDAERAYDDACYRREWWNEAQAARRIEEIKKRSADLKKEHGIQ
jgi:hypothetical protein